MKIGNITMEGISLASQHEVLEKVKLIPREYIKEFSSYVDSFLVKINVADDSFKSNLDVMNDDKAQELFDFFSGSIEREIDEKKELLEARDEKYAHFS